MAKEGYIAIAPAIYQRQAPGFTAGYTAEDLDKNVGWVKGNETQHTL